MIDVQSIKSRITSDDIIAVMDSMGVPLVSANNQYQLYPSRCHHADWQNHKAKLYMYNDTKMFHCYSCGESFDIFGIVQKVKQCDFNSSIAYICEILHINPSENVQKENVDNWQSDLVRWVKGGDESETVEIPTYNKSAVELFDRLYPQDWLQYGISADTMDKFGIGWYGRKACITVPVWQGDKLVGIRGRYMRPQDTERGKYRPVSDLSGRVYKYPTNAVLYGYNENKWQIQRSKTVWLVEAEKTVLKFDTWGINNSVAVFGSNVSKRQIQMLIELGVNNVILGFDSDYKQMGDDDYKLFIEKTKRTIAKLKPFFSVEVFYNCLGFNAHKFSPTDYTREQFNELCKHMVKVN